MNGKPNMRMNMSSSIAFLMRDEVSGRWPRGGLRVDWPFVELVLLPLLLFMLIRLRKFALDLTSLYLDGANMSLDFIS